MIRKVITNDYTAKIISVILALIVWVQVFNDKNPLERRIFAVDVVPKEVSERSSSFRLILLKSMLLLKDVPGPLTRSMKRA